MHRAARAPRIPSTIAALLAAVLVWPVPASGAAPAAPPVVALATTASASVTPTPSVAGTQSAETTASPASIVQQNNGRLVYFGPWSQVSDAGASGGTYRTTSAAGATLHLAFEGTSVAWIGPMGPGFGRAEVHVDGVRVATANQWASATKRKRTIWKSGTLSPGRHMLEVRVLAPISGSCGARTAVDGFAIVGRLLDPALPAAYARVEEGDARLTLFGSWKRVANSSASSGAVRVSTSNGSGALVAFKGSAIALLGPVGPSYGKATVYLDGVSVGTLTQYARSALSRQPLWSALGLAEGAHIVEVRPAPAASAPTRVSAIALDAIWLKGRIAQAPVRVEEGDSKLGTSGSWASLSSSGMSGGRYLRATTGRAAVAARFSGTGVRVLGLKSPTSGEVEIVLDGVPQGVVSLYSSSTRSQQTVFAASGLAPGTHDLEVRALGTAAPGSTGVLVGIDAFELQGTALQASVPSGFVLAEEDDADLALSGAWRHGSVAAMSSGGYAYAQEAGGELTATFEGTGVRWVGPRSATYGKAEVLIDGTSRGVVSQYGSGRLYRQHLWSVSGLAPGQHTFTLRVLDSRDARGATRAVAVDALEIIDGSLTTSARPPGVSRLSETDSRLATLGTWASGQSAMRTTDTESRTKDARSRFDVKFNGASAAWIGQRGPDRGICEVLIDGTSVGTVDLYAPATTSDRVLFTATASSAGEHVVSIRPTGRRNRASSSFLLGVGAIDVVGQPLECAMRFEESDWRLVYSGDWSSRLATAASEGRMRAAEATSASLTAAFSGTSIAILAEAGPAAGIASITVDGGQAIEVDLYAAQAEARKRVYGVNGLALGEHVVRVECTGRANAASSDNKVAIDAFETDGTLVPQTAAQKARAAAVDTAIAQLGRKYVWAGVGPSVFDCSGLMLFSYRAAGVSLPHYSGSQWGLCVPKKVGELEPGDLCFDDGPGRIHHVGMYVGDGITINAPGSGRYVEYRTAASYGCFGRLKSWLWPR